MVALWREATILKQPQKFIVLAMDVTTELEKYLQLQKNGLAQENLPAFEAQSTNLILCQLYILSMLQALHFQQVPNGPAGAQWKSRLSFLLWDNGSSPTVARQLLPPALPCLLPASVSFFFKVVQRA